MVVILVSTAVVWLPVGREKIYENYDGPYYVAVARSWYNKEILGRNFSFPIPLEYYAAHFPLYPALINAISAFGLNRLQAMLAVNLAATAAAAMVIYKVVEVQKWGNPLWVALAWLFVWPRMWAVRVVGSPETLFVLWIIASLYFFQKRKFWQAAIFGSLAVSTKSPGILLFPAYLLWWGENFMKTKKWEGKIYPILLIPAALAAVFGLFWLRTGDFWAYFHSGDNIHLQLLPFKVFDSSQSWVGNFWLEDVLWIYFIGALGIYHAFKKSRVWGWWGAVFFVSILFVSHRDISRYSLPLVPIVLVGLSEFLNRKEVRLTLLLFLIPAYLYTVNFVSHNFFPISDWGPFL